MSTSRIFRSFGKTMILYMVFVLLVALAAGCTKYRDISVSGCRIETVSPSGFKAVDLGLSAEVDNPVREIRVSGISGKVYIREDEFADFKAQDFVVPARSVSDVHVSMRASLAGSFNIMQLMTLAQDFSSGSIYVDVSMEIKVKGGLKKKIDLKRLPVEDLIRKVQYESI